MVKKVRREVVGTLDAMRLPATTIHAHIGNVP